MFCIEQKCPLTITQNQGLVDNDGDDNAGGDYDCHDIVSPEPFADDNAGGGDDDDDDDVDDADDNDDDDDDDDDDDGGCGGAGGGAGGCAGCGDGDNAGGGDDDDDDDDDDGCSGGARFDDDDDDDEDDDGGCSGDRDNKDDEVTFCFANHFTANRYVCLFVSNPFTPAQAKKAKTSGFTMAVFAPCGEIWVYIANPLAKACKS
ncbi:hypothetical protein PoB_007066600 [Plakobranchus ocellatus]|uniref:Uncharacterized protein n=1 Tax=Plakobranchus ocellatus TaxID=259542 RepID=A0AAV4DJW3_9GAST|nr:hypothetical protein PoB_007066600 [Plakobranchus ocellatus]